jgi:hypothetical protein
MELRSRLRQAFWHLGQAMNPLANLSCLQVSQAFPSALTGRLCFRVALFVRYLAAHLLFV